MTSVFPEGLVETVAKAMFEAMYPNDHWDAISDTWGGMWRRQAVALLEASLPCVAGLIADRLDEEVWETFDGADPAAFVRREYGSEA